MITRTAHDQTLPVSTLSPTEAEAGLARWRSHAKHYALARCSKTLWDPLWLPPLCA
jgi:hypothetical protein